MTTPTPGGGPPVLEPTVAEHVASGHDDDLGHATHGAEETPLGPIDVFAWGAGILGVGLGLAVALAFALSTGMLG